MAASQSRRKPGAFCSPFYDLARRLQMETAITWPWIANRLAVGLWRTAANAIRATLQPNVS
jgi:hypothetical protein